MTGKELAMVQSLEMMGRDPTRRVPAEVLEVVQGGAVHERGGLWPTRLSWASSRAASPASSRSLQTSPSSLHRELSSHLCKAGRQWKTGLQD